MQIVNVSASHPYEVVIEDGISSRIGEILNEHFSVSTDSRIVLVSDATVFGIYGFEVIKKLSLFGYEVLPYSFESGEKSKSIDEYIKLIKYLTEHGINRSDCLLVLGGGVAGDLGGYAAATYKRGMKYAMVPTSLLAMVDASVGGKTAIDLPEGKNLIGTVYQPKGVIIDPAFLKTLPENYYREGLAEVIKYAILTDPELLVTLSDTEKVTEEIITRCIQIKAEYVASDEFDYGRRRFLNLGHTIGHAIETCSGYTVRHGEAVALGLMAVARAGHMEGITSDDCLIAIETILKKFGLLKTVPYSDEELFSVIMQDKKNESGMINWIVPKSIGNCEIYPLDKENSWKFLLKSLAKME